MAFKGGNVIGTINFNATGSGTTSIGATSNSGAISIGNTSSGAVSIDCGTAGIIVGTTANAHASTIGSTNSTSSTTVQSGSGALNVTSTNGALTINSGTGTLGISTDASANTINIGTGGAVKSVTLGSTTTTSSTAIKSGAGNIIHNTGLTIDSTGRMTNAVQPAFLALKSANTANATGDGTVFTVVFDTSVFDQNSNYAIGTGIFTAPKTGIYHFDFNCSVFNEGAAHTQGFFDIVTTAKSFQLNFCNPFVLGTTNGQFNFTGGITCAMTSGDTAKCTAQVSGGTKTVGIAGQATPLETCFSGFLVC